MQNSYTHIESSLLKIPLKGFSIALLLLSVIACSTTNNRSGPLVDIRNYIIPARELPYHIDKISRLSVRGSGINIKVINTSVSTFSGEVSPLFVLDGVQLGRDFSKIMLLLHDQQGVFVEFITTREATVKYGEAGKNGVLIINKANKDY